jgi:methylmalonyl-CoA mutase
VAANLPKLRIEESAARRQARVDSGQDVVVGVNKYPNPNEVEIPILDVDTAKVQESQIRRLEQVRANRDPKACEAALAALTECARTKDDNRLLELAVAAARARATVGEISDALETVFTRHRAAVKSISGVYGAAYEGNDAFVDIREDVAKFAEEEGRRPRILVVKLGQDGHDRGARVIASAFADAGFDVDMGPLFQTPAEAAQQAMENDVHVVGVSSLAAGHKTLVPKLIEELKKLGGEDILVVVGGVVPPQDHAFLLEQGVGAIFVPGTKIPEAAAEIIKLLRAKRR